MDYELEANRLRLEVSSLQEEPQRADLRTAEWRTKSEALAQYIVENLTNKVTGMTTVDMGVMLLEHRIRRERASAWDQGVDWRDEHDGNANPVNPYRNLGASEVIGNHHQVSRHEIKT